MLHVSRTWTTVTTAHLDNVPMFDLTHTVTLRADGDTLSAEVDGQPAELQEATRLITAAQDHGRCVLVSEDRWEDRPTISKAEAAALHRHLGRLGIRNHYGFVTETVGFSIATFAELSPEDVELVHSRLNAEIWGAA